MALASRANCTLILLACVFSLTARAGSSEIAYLASDAYVSIAGHQFIIPVVAVRLPDHGFDLGQDSRSKIKDKHLSNDPTKPTTLVHIDLLIRQYQYTGELTASAGICPLLKRAWSDAWCRGEAKGLLSRLPEKFDLFDQNELEHLKSYRTVGGERVYDQLSAVPSRAGLPSVGCDTGSRFCTASVEVSPRLLAIWTVWNDETGTGATQMAETQGLAIAQFVQRAIGKIEDPTLLNTE